MKRKTPVRRRLGENTAPASQRKHRAPKPEAETRRSLKAEKLDQCCTDRAYLDALLAKSDGRYYHREVVKADVGCKDPVSIRGRTNGGIEASVDPKRPVAGAFPQICV